jgi:NAD(P)-dependent dehydrogenase (short-subunit alcohol dehydrogenase family)
VNRNTYRGLFDLTGKVAVVTGGIGILGRRFCAGLADVGAHVAVVDLDEAKAVEFASELENTFGVSCLGVGCDVADPASVETMVVRVGSELGAIDIVHNNAASQSGDLNKFYAPAEDFSLETWREVMSVNLDGMFLVAQAVGKRMAVRGKGSIIQTASIYGVMGPDQRIYEGSEYRSRPINTPPVYSASKAGVIGLTRYLATYWANKGVRVNSLTPGGVESGQNAIFNSRYSNRVPMKRMAQPNEMVGALIFLASDASSYITGQNIMVDGGLSAW